MELDLDSFLNSRPDVDADDADDDDGNSTSFPCRTVDEILNDSLSDSSSSSPAGSRPSSPVPSFSTPQEDDAVSVRSTESLKLPPSDAGKSVSSSFHRRPSRGVDTFPRFRPPDHVRRSLPAASGQAPASRQLPPLFGGVRSSAKPGAALAAAAAASRTVPTPHAAAIKSRRALLGRLSSDASDHLRSSSSSASSSSSNEISLDSARILDERLGVRDDRLLLQDEHEGGENDSFSDFHSASGDGFSTRELPPSVDTEAESREPEEKEKEKDMSSPPLAPEDLAAAARISTSSTHAEDSGKYDTLALTPAATVSHSEEMGSEGEEEEEEEEENDEEEEVVGDSGDKDPEIDELVEERIGRIGQSDIKRTSEKKPEKVKPLELAEQAERRQASTALHWEEGAAAQPMRLEGVRRGSTTLGYFDINAENVITRTLSSQAFRRDHGSPEVLAVHGNYIAVGMSRGIIILLPSKYSPHQPDNMEAKMTMLGLQGDRSYAAVTSLSFNHQGDLLLAGYGDGHVTLWDVQRGSAAKVITGEHTVPVVHAFFLGQDSQVTRQFKAVTGDSNGLVLLHSFSVVPLLNRFSIKTQCLLDGLKTGTVLSASPLIFDEFFGGALLSSHGNNSGSSSTIGGADTGWKLFNEGTSFVEEGVVVFVTHQTALVVRLSPALKVYATLPKPDGVREGSMPYTAWKCTTQACAPASETNPEGAADRVSLLAIAWDRKVQVAKLVNSELKVYGNWSLDSAAIGVAWLDDQMLVVLSLTGQLWLFAKDGTVIHQTSFAVDNLRGDDLISYHTHFINIFGNPEKAYHNSVAVRGASVYILGPMHLLISRLLPWKERIQVLRKAGDWMCALNMGMTLYDGQAHGVIDLPRTLDAVQSAIMPYLVELLLSYVEEVFSYISVAFCNQIEKVQQVNDHSSRSSSVQNDIKEQFTRVGGVAVEFCVHIKRTDILFEEIFSKFVSVNHRDTFLELLEPYILKDMLSCLPPEIMQALVEHYSGKGWLQRVEQCVLHMDISSLDFNQVVKLCREHGLYCALVYLFNRGLDDFRSPLEELLVVLRNSQRESAVPLGYKMLVYLKYCFTGFAFPPGHGNLPGTRLPSLRAELVQFLLEESEASTSSSDRPYLNLYHLLELDTEATLEVLKCAFAKDETQAPDISLSDSANQLVGTESEFVAGGLKLIQEVVDALVCILNKDISQMHEYRNDDDKVADAWPSLDDMGYLFEFIAYFISRKWAKVSRDVLTRILEHLTSDNLVSAEVPENKEELLKKREKQVLSLLETLPESDWDAAYVLNMCENAQFFLVCGFIHTMQNHHLAALDSYMKDVDEPVHAFAFIDSAISLLNEADGTAFRSAVISRIPALVDLSREAAFFLVIDHFNSQSERILSELEHYPSSLFLYLKTVVEVHLSGSLDFTHLTKSDMANFPNGGSGNVHMKRLKDYLKKVFDFPRFLRNNPIDVTDDMVERYLELLCQYERNSVLKFLETFDSYRVEHCLRLCQEYGITDAAAFLLERVGDVGSALLLTLSSLNDKFAKLDIVVSEAMSGMKSSNSGRSKLLGTILKTKEVEDILQILNACVGLCQRNTPRLNPEESEILWFRLLDSFCEPLMGLSNGEKIAEEDHVGTLAEPLGSIDDEGPLIRWRISKSHRGARIFRKLFSRFIKEIVEGMIGYVRLPTIMSKLLLDNGNQEFGDFKLTILGMLGTYGFERRILDTAKSLIEDDTFYTMSLLKKGASHGYAPRSQVCCICNCPLTRGSFGSTIRVFNCGHATHAQCESVEIGASSKGTPSGCPICLPKKSEKLRSKSAFGEDGLVRKTSSRRARTEGSTSVGAHENHNDIVDTSYGIQQISRFDLLANLLKDHGPIQIENLPPLRLAPPALYHDKVKKGVDLLAGESSIDPSKMERPTGSNRQFKELRVKGSSIRFPLKSSIFGKERTRQQ
ncbi:vacuolar protein sorting-associated protein 8 homolog [Punica granatum]|uniref:Vacuolar protein sorting-associated protein 8 homolog n=1 Tax=Punica granatum TaxID=22663 RepID=A0A6P8CLN5_PUNGR|nr:vacuolar protein sorting-associated protein 8 homolog [Punica granatum]